MIDPPLTPLVEPPQTPFTQLEALTLFWKDMENSKWRWQDAPQLQPIIEGAITRVRLEIILLCQEITKDEPNR